MSIYATVACGECRETEKVTTAERGQSFGGTVGNRMARHRGRCGCALKSMYVSYNDTRGDTDE